VEYPDYDSDEEPQPEPFDLEAVNRRLAALGNGSVFEGADLDEYALSGLDDESASWDNIDLEDVFDLPPVLPPVRWRPGSTRSPRSWTPPWRQRTIRISSSPTISTWRATAPRW
jgi:hypothetical protein